MPLLVIWLVLSKNVTAAKMWSGAGAAADKPRTDVALLINE